MYCLHTYKHTHTHTYSLDELLVGAPMYRNGRNADAGRVFIYSNTGVSLEESIAGSTSFGASLTSLTGLVSVESVLQPEACQKRWASPMFHTVFNTVLYSVIESSVLRGLQGRYYSLTLTYNLAWLILRSGAKNIRAAKHTKIPAMKSTLGIYWHAR